MVWKAQPVYLIIQFKAYGCITCCDKFRCVGNISLLRNIIMPALFGICNFLSRMTLLVSWRELVPFGNPLCLAWQRLFWCFACFHKGTYSQVTVTVCIAGCFYTQSWVPKHPLPYPLSNVCWACYWLNSLERATFLPPCTSTHIHSQTIKRKKAWNKSPLIKHKISVMKIQFEIQFGELHLLTKNCKILKYCFYDNPYLLCIGAKVHLDLEHMRPRIWDIMEIYS